MAFTLNMTGLSRTRYTPAPSVAIIQLSPFFKRIYKDDLQNIFFNTNQLAEPVTYTHSDGQVKIYSVIYDDPRISVKFGADAEFNSLRPQFQISESELLAPIAKNDRVRVRGVLNYIDDYASDGVGVTTAFLRLK